MTISDTTSTRGLSALFTTATLRALAAPAPWEALGRLEQVDALMASPDPLGAGLDRIFETLRRNRRSEYVYKNEIISRIVFGRHSPTTTSATTEFSIGRSIADVLVFNGTTTAYEIKTDFDSFARLGSQLSDYATVAERVFVVTSPQRAQTALDLTPDHVGVLSLSVSGRISTWREAASGLDRITYSNLFRVLRVGERREILGQYDKPFGDKSAVQELAVFQRMPLKEAHAAVTSALRKRFQTAIVTREAFPSSLRALAYGVNLSGTGQSRLSDRLRRTPGELRATG